jgi:hypothetical protein
MNPMSEKRLQEENDPRSATGGRSQENRGFGFRAAFLDFATQTIYPSRFADGRPASFHLLDGLPDEMVIDRSPAGRVLYTKPTLIAGFERHGYFYTRRAAERALMEWSS